MISFKDCGILFSCSNYISSLNKPTLKSMRIMFSLQYYLKKGLNNIDMFVKYRIKKGYMIYLSNFTENAYANNATIGVEDSNKTIYSDLYSPDNINLYKFSKFNNKRLLFNVIIDTQYFFTIFDIVFNYSFIGTYNLSSVFQESSIKKFVEIQVSNGKLINLVLI